MDIRKLVNTQGQARDMAGRDWQPHQTLPPFSAMFPDPSYAQQGYHYPIPPQGEGFNGYAQYQAYHQPQHPQLYTQPQVPQAQAATLPQYARQEMPYLSSNQSVRSSSSNVSVTSTKYAPSNASSGPATSAERRSLGSDEEDDDSDEDMSGGSSSPLPPYHYSSQTPAPQQVCFLDTSVHQPSSQNSPIDGVDFVCDDCGVSYSRAPDLRRHKASVHNDKESREKVAATFPCEVCGQVLLSSHGYQGHMRRHYDERPFVCEAPFCGKAFHDSATLARHRRTHSTEHKFECDFCGRRFKRKDNLNTHRKKHQVGGESINPNLLRKPVTRVSGPTDSPPGGTPQAPAYGELPLATPAYHSLPQSAAPPYAMAVPDERQHMMHQTQAPSAFVQHHHQMQYVPQPPAPPYYQQATPFQQHQQQHFQQQQRQASFVKAEDTSEMMEYRNRPRMSHLPPMAR